MSDHTWVFQLIMVILSVGATACPIFFGFVLWRMSQVFVTRNEMAELKDQLANERKEMSRKLDHINDTMTELLQRTARTEKR